jgi:hypothetical protein
LLVAGDPDSLSETAKTAREHMVPIVAESALLGLVLAMGD